MKLYATIRSERASKGQGGNEFLQVQFYDEDKIIVGSLALKAIFSLTISDKIVGHWLFGSFYGRNIDIDSRETKGEKQKDI